MHKLAMTMHAVVPQPGHVVLYDKVLYWNELVCLYSNEMKHLDVVAYSLIEDALQSTSTFFLTSFTIADVIWFSLATCHLQAMRGLCRFNKFRFGVP